MNIGFTTLFAYRPHVEHMYFLSRQLEKAGHVPYYLNCSGLLKSCYTQELKKNSALFECSKCLAGSLYSFTKKNNTFIDKTLSSNISNEEVSQYIASSSFTLTRIEDIKHQNIPEIKKIQNRFIEAYFFFFKNTLQWIESNKIDYVYVFNGRMDITRAVIEACRKNNTPFACIERTWFGNGIQITPNKNCLSLKHLHSLSKNFMHRPLTRSQATHSAAFLAKRFQKNDSNSLEWRTYHDDNMPLKWPLSDQSQKVLIIPSSKNEQMGQDDWEKTLEDNYTDNFLKILKKLNIHSKNCILRAHPNWGQNIGTVSGSSINDYYKSWALKNSIHYIEPSEKVDTSSLIKQADLVILNGSSAVYECAFFGTPSICIGPCHYSQANISNMVLSEQDLNQLNLNQILNFSKRELLRRTLRFIYIFGFRYAYFFNEIKAKTTTEYLYSDINIKVLENIMNTSKLEGYDPKYSDDSYDEDKIIDLIFDEKFDALKNTLSIKKNLHLPIKRRGVFRALSLIRNFFKRGDL